MQSASGQPAAVLDYAPAAPLDAATRRIRAVATVLFCMLLGAAGGWIIDPRIYRAVGILQVAQTRVTPTADEQVLDVNALQSQQAAVVAGITAPANLNVAVTKLPPTITLTPAQMAPHLKAQTVPQSQLISVSYEDPDPRTAAAVVNAVMSQPLPSGVVIAVAATPPAQPQRNRLYVVGGLAVGLLLGVFIVALRWK